MLNYSVIIQANLDLDRWEIFDAGHIMNTIDV